MTTDDKAYAFYLIILLVAIGGSFLYSRRESFGKTVQQALIWILIFVGVIIAYGFGDVFKAQLYPSSAIQNGVGSVTLTRARDGHFYASLRINDRDIEFVIDTGATAVVLSKKDAEYIGIILRRLN